MSQCTSANIVRFSARARVVTTLVAMSAIATLSPASTAAQTSPAAGPLSATPYQAQASALPAARRLSADDAVRLALEQNLGLQVERLNPQIQDFVVSGIRSAWKPVFSSNLNTNSTNNPSTSSLQGGQTKVTDSRFTTEVGVDQTLKTGATYSASWNSYRSTSTNIFSNFDPLLNSSLRFNITQPLLRDFKIDRARQQLELSLKDRTASDVQLKSAITLTTRNVRNAYWELIYQIDNLKAVQQSLDLARRVLSDNEKRVQVGTMAPIDIIEAQAEIARNEGTVIVAEEAIQDAEDRLRSLIFDPAMPDFWNISIEPVEQAPFQAQAIDVEAAVRRALEQRTDVWLAKNNLEQNEMSIRYLHNQSLPDVSASLAFSSTAAGGTQLSSLTSIPVGETPVRTVASERGLGSVLGDTLTGAYPTWTLGVSVSYPLGQSAAESDLARARLQHSKAQTEMKELEMRVGLEVRSVGRQVQTNQKRVDSTRVARELAERRLDAAQKKFAAGIETSFFVFQAQRDLTQARTAEVRAISDYNRSLVDFDAVQTSPLLGTTSVTTVR